ncbi:MAG: tetratricopeptide repeat protein [Elusimicrobia bacterium]|nr:tetratricopeptide repeat protein [Elusimicrobiota bacterium]
MSREAILVLILLIGLSIFGFFRFRDIKKGLHDKAIADFTTAIKINPDDAEAHYNRGISYSYKDACNEAIKDFTKAIELNPKYVEAYNNRGNVYFDKGLYDKALNDYNKAIEIDPNFAEAYYNRGNVYSIKGLYDKALDEINPEPESMHKLRGVRYILLINYINEITNESFITKHRLN